MKLKQYTPMLAQRLKELRFANEFTQRNLSDYLEINEKTYSKYESGTREPCISRLIQIASLYDVSLDYLVGNECKGDILNDIKK